MARRSFWQKPMQSRGGRLWKGTGLTRLFLSWQGRVLVWSDIHTGRWLPSSYSCAVAICVVYARAALK